MKEGLVMKSTGSWYLVAESEKQYQCRVRGKLRLKDYKYTNPVAVGDHVRFTEEEEHPGKGIIHEVVPRENFVIRKSPRKTQHGHILAANIDQAILIATLVYPRTSLGFIDRFLVTTESFRIPASIIFNKIDILDEEGIAIQDEYRETYEKIGFKTIAISALSKEGIEEVHTLLDHRVNLIAGHSGVGKSTIINAMGPAINQKIAEVSDFAQKGVHATTFAEMFQVNNDTFVIDTPGIKELGLLDIEDWELSDYFPEMRELRNKCKYHNCTHSHEPGCLIKEYVEEGKIAVSRYYSYLSMLEDEDNRR